METDCRQKKGYTLVEVLVVVAIIGVLSTMGVASLRGAVANARIKDASINTAAFMERVGNDANRLSSKVCVKKENTTTLVAYKGACDSNPTDELARFQLESVNKFIAGDCSGTTAFDNAVDYTPRIGLSAVPTGCYKIQYGETDRMGSAVKTATKNSVFYRLSYDSGSSWSEM